MTNISRTRKIDSDYKQHFLRMNPAENIEDVYSSAKSYYEAEIASILPASKETRIVDIGVGLGALVNYLITLGYRHVGGVDTSQALIGIVRKQLIKHLDFLLNVDGKDFLAKNKNKFGLITMIDVIEHFDLVNGKLILEAAYKSLKVGGGLVIRTPNMANIFGSYSRYLDLTHYSGYTEYSLIELLTQSGFNNVRLVKPLWVDKKKIISVLVNELLHKKLYQLQDRVIPKCFDKNIVVYAQK